MKNTRKLILMITLIVLTLLAVASAILVYWFVPMTPKDIPNDNYTDDFAVRRISRWEFYARLRTFEADYGISLTIPVPDEAIQIFSSEEYKKDYDSPSQYFDEYAHAFLTTHELIPFDDAKIRVMGGWQGSPQNPRLQDNFLISITGREITPKQYLKVRRILNALIEEETIVKAHVNSERYPLVSTSNARVSSAPTFPLRNKLFCSNGSRHCRPTYG